VSESVRPYRESTARRRWARGTLVLAALAICWGGATKFSWHHDQTASPSSPETREPFGSPTPSHRSEPIASIAQSGSREPFVLPTPNEARGPMASTEPHQTFSSPEVPELVDSLAASASKVRRIRVGIFSDKSCCDEPEPLTRILDALPSCNWELLTPMAIQADRLDRFDVLIFPGGRGHRQAAALGDEGRRAVQDFVRAGGGFVGICAGGFLATAQYDWSLGLVNTRTLHGDREIPGIGKKSMADRGPGAVKIELTGAGRAVFGDIQQPFDVSFSGGPIYHGPMRSDLPPSVPLAYYRTELVN
jgi:hypothetical protein